MGDAGGGEVLVPHGVSRAAALELCSNVTLRLAAGAVFRGIDDVRAFDRLGFRTGMFYTLGAENAAIEGSGAIDGNGVHFHFPDRRHGGGDFDPAYTRQDQALKRMEADLEHGPWAYEDRPTNMLIFAGCKNVRVTGVTLTNPGEWCLHFGDCSDVRAQGSLPGFTTMAEPEGAR